MVGSFVDAFVPVSTARWRRNAVPEKASRAHAAGSRRSTSKPRERHDLRSGFRASVEKSLRIQTAANGSCSKCRTVPGGSGTRAPASRRHATASAGNPLAPGGARSGARHAPRSGTPRTGKVRPRRGGTVPVNLSLPSTLCIIGVAQSRSVHQPQAVRGWQEIALEARVSTSFRRFPAENSPAMSLLTEMITG